MRAFALLQLALVASCCARAGGVGAAAAAHAHAVALRELGAAPLRAVYPPASGGLPPELLSGGVANLGSSARTAALLAKLRRGEAVTLLVLGGSVTNRHAGCTDALVRCAGNVSGSGDGACCGLVEVRDHPESHAARGAGWARMFLDWLADTWPPAAPGRHRLYNAGVVGAGNSPEPFVHCWLGRLPAQFDLALLETHVQDSHQRPGGADAALEHLLRALLSHGGGVPVVALVPSYNWCHGPAWSVMSADHVCRAHPGLNKTATSLYTPFAAGGGGYEDAALTLAQYYSLPALSQRNALFTWLASNASGWALPGDASEDGPHPAPPMQRVVADILVHWWRLIALTHTYFDEPVAHAAAPQPLPLPAAATSLPYVTQACYGQNSGLRALAVAPEDGGGFAWRDEASRAEGAKFGFEAAALNATVAFKVTLRRPQLPVDDDVAAAAVPLVGVELLHTARDGGAARLSCDAGCSCEAVTVDCAAAAFSLPRTHHLRVAAAAADCVVRVTVARAGRVKVLGITLGASRDGAVPQPGDAATYFAVPLAPELGNGEAQP